MKKFTLLTFVSLFLLAFSSSAQITKGSVFIGGSIGFSHLTQQSNGSPTEAKNSSIYLGPVIGKAIKENLVVGLQLTYSKSKADSSSYSSRYNNRGYSAGVFMRRYYPVASGFYLLGQANLGYGHSNSENGFYPTYKVNTNNIALSLQPGLAYHVAKAFYIEMAFDNLLQLGYTENKEYIRNNPTDISRTTKGFSLSSSLSNSTSLNVGVRFIIPRKAK